MKFLLNNLIAFVPAFNICFQVNLTVGAESQLSSYPFDLNNLGFVIEYLKKLPPLGQLHVFHRTYKIPTGQSTRAINSALSEVIRPPSPEFRCLYVCVLKQAAKPKLPLFLLPPLRAHSMGTILNQNQILLLHNTASIYSYLQYVLSCAITVKNEHRLKSPFVTRSSRSSTRFSLISTNIALPPALEIAPGTGAKVYIFVKTYSPRFQACRFQ